ncbi:poly-beta-1,6-N-acetyl-D-glucosamine biosynthesis protein PgaD [Dyella silvatica]|uniref:poly-beta-1,6-N-acetyl-D-glucosamine biosynthesis protein PgaD n=1 Tax=Dyella silvatica TaxID=2992128 RepID=UPI00225B8021|nr:poly-beta-1,6-N-acetyl-D-glucosamine biosynthesis protein PgaD [Dyella silvatica]
MKAEAIVIQRPERQRPAQRLVFSLLTLLAWVAWSALWLPLITLVAWALGLRNGYVELMLFKHGNGGHDLWMVAMIAAVCTVIVWIWSEYNQLRFGKGQPSRRQGRPIPDARAMAHALKVQQPTALRLRAERRVVLDFLDDGTVTHRADTVIKATRD